jgi:hypothetical protein
VDLYIHSLIHLHGVVLNFLSTGTTLPFTFYIHVTYITYLLFSSLNDNSDLLMELLLSLLLLGARGNVVGRGTMLQAGSSRARFPMRLLDFSVDVILPAAPWPWGRPSL